MIGKIKYVYGQMISNSNGVTDNTNQTCNDNVLSLNESSSTNDTNSMITSSTTMKQDVTPSKSSTTTKEKNTPAASSINKDNNPAESTFGKYLTLELGNISDIDKIELTILD